MVAIAVKYASRSWLADENVLDELRFYRSESLTKKFRLFIYFHTYSLTRVCDKNSLFRIQIQSSRILRTLQPIYAMIKVGTKHGA